MESEKKSEFEAIMNAFKDIKNQIKEGRKEFQNMREILNDDFTRINEKLDRIIQISNK